MNKKFNSALSVILAVLIIFSSAVCGVAVNSNTDATEEITTTVESTTVADTSEEATSVEATTDKTTASEEETTIETTAEPSVEETTTELTTEATTETTAVTEPSEEVITTTTPSVEETTEEEITTEEPSTEETTSLCPDNAHKLITKLEKASMEKDGYKLVVCENCGYVAEETVIYQITDIVLLADDTELINNEITYTGDNYYIKAIAYDKSGNSHIEYNDFKLKGSRSNYKIGTYKLTIDFYGDYYDVSEVLKYRIVAPEINSPVINSVKSVKKGVVISWNDTDNADGYYIYRKTKSTESWKEIKKIETTEYTDSAVKYNNEYSYLVKAYKIIGGKEFTSKNDEGVSVKTKYVVTPEAPKVEMADYGIKISWSKVSGATKYYVYRATSKNGSYSKLGSTTKNYFSDKKTDLGKTYYYKIKAYTYSKASSASSYTSAKCVLPAPVINKKVTANSTSFTISWNKLSRADGYYVYKLDGKKYTKLAEVKSGSSLEYTYKSKKLTKIVIAAYYKNSKGKKILSDYSNVCYANAIAKPTIELEALAYNKKIYINSNTKTNSYQIYYKVGKNGKWKLLATGNQYMPSNTVSKSHEVELNKNYYYKMRNVDIKAGNTVYGEFSEIKQLTFGYIPGVSVTLPKKTYTKGQLFQVTIKNNTKKSLQVYPYGYSWTDTLDKSGDINAPDKLSDIKAGKSAKINFMLDLSNGFYGSSPTYKTTSNVLFYFKHNGINYASVYNYKAGEVFKN